jgi:large subunit ribosomal protein L24
MHIKKGDTVVVMSGDDRVKRGKVLLVVPRAGKIKVEGVNKVYKHVKPNQRNRQGGRLSKEMPIDVSNVMLIDPQSNAPTRVGIRYLADGSKERYAKRSGASLGRVSGPRKAYAKGQQAARPAGQ